MSPDEWGSSRLEEMAQRVAVLTGKYEDMSQKLTRLDEQGANAAGERQELRQAMKDLTTEMRGLLKEIDRSCQEKVDSVGRTVRDEIKTQIALALAGEADQRRWPSKDRAMISLSALAVVGSVLTAVIK